MMWFCYPEIVYLIQNMEELFFGMRKQLMNGALR